MRVENAAKALTVLSLGAMLTVGVGGRWAAGAAAQAAVRRYAGQVREIKIDSPRHGAKGRSPQASGAHWDYSQRGAGPCICRATLTTPNNMIGR
jgi:hypothetical protein